MRYRWEIKTSDTWYAGTDASVFLSLSGLDASMREVQISDPDAINDWEKGDINHGSIETEDLGELQTGTLRHDNSGPASGWSVDWVKVTNEEDGREWTATVGGFDTGGRFPLLRFSRSNDGQYEQAKKLKAKRAADATAKESADKLAAKRQVAEQESSSSDAALDDELVKKQRDLDRELRRAQAEAKIAEQRAKLDTLRGGGATPIGGTPDELAAVIRKETPEARERRDDSPLRDQLLEFACVFRGESRRASLVVVRHGECSERRDRRRSPPCALRSAAPRC